MFLANYQVVAFDAVGTLLHPMPSGISIYAAVGRRHGSRHDQATVQQRFAAALAAEEEVDGRAGWRTSEERERERWQRIVATVLDDVANVDACFTELYEHFARPEAWCLAPHTSEVLHQLTELGFRLVLASNYDHRLHQVMAGFAPLQLLSQVVISAEVGWRKPAPAFFAAMATACQIPISQIVYVGDDLGNDFAGATTAGLGAVLFDPRNKRPDFPGPRVQGLVDLYKFLSQPSQAGGRTT